MPLDPTEQAAVDLYKGFRVHQTFAEETLQVHNKQGIEIPYRLGPAQKRLVDTIEARRALGIPPRLLYLKARQVWGSTALAGYFFHRIAFTPGQDGYVLAHLKPNAEEIFNYYKQFQKSYLPFRDRVAQPALLRPAAAGHMEWDNGSKIEVKTARNLVLGRGFKARFLHLSEAAFYIDSATLMTGLLNAVPDDPDTVVVKETTANGINAFHSEWQAAYENPAPDNIWVPVFFAWHEHPEYARPLLIDKHRFQESMDKEERQIQARFRLSLDQLYWRRWAITNKCEGSVERFRQEYPGHPEEAFRSSGRPRFSFADLARQPVVQEAFVGELSERELGTRTVIDFLPNEGGALRVFKRPVAGHHYALGADTATGIDANDGEGTADPDFCSGQVLDVRSGEQVAKLRARMEPSPFAEYLALLGRWYNWAFLVPEITGCGIATVERLLKVNYPPHRLYHRRGGQATDLTRHGTTNLSYVGWGTTTVTRPQLISKLDTALRETSILIRDPHTLHECQTFVIKPNGKAEAAPSFHDDDVIALALALVGLESYPHEPARSDATFAPKKYGQRDESNARREVLRSVIRRS